MEPVEPSRTISKSKFKQLKLDNTDLKREKASEGNFFFMKDIN